MKHLFQPQCYEIRNKLQEKRNCKKHKHIEAKQYATKQPMDHGRNQRGNQKISRDKWQQKHDSPKHVGCSKNSSKREVYSDTSLPQETSKTSNKQPNLISKQLEKEEQTNPKVK